MGKETKTIQVKIYDETFRPDESMVRGHKPKKIEYNNYNYDIVWRTHFDIFKPQVDRFPEYGVAIESAAIMPTLYQGLLQHHNALSERYKAIFTWHPDCLKINPDLFKPIPAYCGWIRTEYGGNKDNLPPKTKWLSTIASEKVFCPGHQLRQMIASQLRGIADCYGNFFKNPVATSWDGIAPYRYHLAVENDAIDNYFTEKLLNCFQTKTVPIYWGCTNLKDFGFNLDGIIDIEEFMQVLQRRQDVSLQDFLSTSRYENMQKAIEENYEIAMSTYNVGLEDIIYEKYFGK